MGWLERICERFLRRGSQTERMEASSDEKSGGGSGGALSSPVTRRFAAVMAVVENMLARGRDIPRPETGGPV